MHVKPDLTALQVVDAVKKGCSFATSTICTASALHVDSMPAKMLKAVHGRISNASGRA